MRNPSNDLKNNACLWLNVLAGLEKENIEMKARLALILKNSVSRSFIDTAESFQQIFIDNDQMISILRHDIHVFVEGVQNDALTVDISRQDQHFNALKNDMMKAVFEFTRNRIEINETIGGL